MRGPDFGGLGDSGRATVPGTVDTQPAPGPADEAGVNHLEPLRLPEARVAGGRARVRRALPNLAIGVAVSGAAGAAHWLVGWTLVAILAGALAAVVAIRRVATRLDQRGQRRSLRVPVPVPAGTRRYRLRAPLVVWALAASCWLGLALLAVFPLPLSTADIIRSVLGTAILASILSIVCAQSALLRQRITVTDAHVELPRSWLTGATDAIPLNGLRWHASEHWVDIDERRFSIQQLGARNFDELLAVLTQRAPRW
jgi:hypothetical protein